MLVALQDAEVDEMGTAFLSYLVAEQSGPRVDVEVVEGHYLVCSGAEK